MGSNFKNVISEVNGSFARRLDLKILQVNLGNMCNQRCIHCHINASPKGTRIMSRSIMDEVIRFLSKKEGLVLDITGGCPELNPNFKYFLEKASSVAGRIIIRNNLTIFFEKGMEDLPELYKKYAIKLICSLPCYTQNNVEKQRGEGAFVKSIAALKLLNALGYGKDKALELDLVYNPGGAFLPGDQVSLEADYKKILRQEHGIEFSHLLTITNVPINRFEQYLKLNGNFDEYMKLLMENFNRDIAGEIMCRNLLSVGWNGIIYDCDFNQALGLALRDENNKIMEISGLNPHELEEKEIIFENHCYCCTAGAGSSCGGALNKERGQ